MTNLLFLFLLGITSWSRYATANTVILTGVNADISDGNGIIDSWDVEIENNALKSNIHILNCSLISKVNGEVLNSLDPSQTNNTQKIFLDQEFNVTLCADEDNFVFDSDVSLFANGLNPGDYMIEVIFRTEDISVADVTMNFTVQD